MSLRALAPSLFILAAMPALAATPLSGVRVSSDTTVTLGSVTANDEDVVSDDLAGNYGLVGVGAIPPETDLDAYAVLPNGDQLLSFDTTVVLSDGHTAHPGDVWRFHAGAYSVEFDAAARGVPPTANLDAVAVRAGSLLLSFDVAIDLGAVHVEPADLVLFDGSGFSLYFNGAAAGVPPGLNLDAADYLPCNGHLLVSFDGSGTIGGVSFDHQDVLEFDGATWSLAYHPSWGSANLDAVHATVNFGPGTPLPFGQTVSADADKATFRWTTSADFRMVRGPFASASDIGTYTVDGTILGTGTTFIDAATPAPGTGFWYLVKRGGCGPTTWQSALGLEPGRDTAIP
ncbi:MAG TPA: hypothetical protein VFV19_18070 [Candidatus Polarisedimenticolaceae bacterium]|nr:hypothetical protein [Candidatus Polarisedimenticolaceae bacterium]